ncbi:MAG: Ig-like domain-containing protein [Actinomycetia bacterium]|nr:Ig-like domain-containing protein [Actinomycetes bacterium]
MSDWTQFDKIINVGSSSKITISFRNNAPGGNGNDIAFDDITVRPMPIAQIVPPVQLVVLATPQANNDSATTPINTPVSGNALTNDVGTGITVTNHSPANHGTVSINPDGTYIYTPASGYTGTDSFSYVITDSVGQTSTATVTINVDALPMAGDDTNHTSINTPVSGTTRTNDSGAGITSALRSQATNGTATVNPDGSYTYTPRPGFTGTDSFQYTITDRNGKTDVATVALTVNALPVAVNDTAIGSINTPVTGNVLSNDSGAGITVTSNTSPSHGAVTVNPGGTYSYTPSAGWTGTDAFTYTITDQNGKTSTAIVTVTVDPLPVANPDSAKTSVGSPATGNVLANDSGVAIKVTSNTPPSHGSVTVNPNGTYVYTPTPGYTGPDSFLYTITDEAGKTSTSQVSLVVDPLPAANSDINHTTVNTAVSGAVLGNDSGVGISVTSHTTPAHGAVTINPDGSYVYTPVANWSGVDTFSYTITDELGKTSTAVVSISVNNLPAAINDSNHTAMSTPITGNVRSNDSGIGIQVTANTQPTHGMAIVNPDGTYTYTPLAGYTGPDAFSYTITDQYGEMAFATVMLTVDPLPLAVDDEASTSVNAAVSGTVLPNDSGVGISVTDNTVPGHGTVVIHPDGTYTYTPAPGYVGADAFSYTITDRNGKTDSAQVNIDVNALPVANPDTVTTGMGQPASGNVLTNDTGTDIAVSSHTPPAHGTLTLNPDGTYRYTPTPGYTGPDSFTYTITDELGKTSTATVSLTVDPLPVAGADSNHTSVGTPVSGTTRSNDSGAGINVSSNTQPTHGTVVVNPDGTYTYTPVAGYTGPDSFGYTITDRNGNTALATVTLRVDPLPVAGDDTAHTAAGTPLNGTTRPNDTGVGLETELKTPPVHGSVVVNPDGTYSYTPDAGYTGPDSFSYTLTDENGETDVALVTLTVDALPVAVDDTATTGIGQTKIGSVLPNDTGVGISVTSNTQPLHGSAAVNPDGSYSYVPAAGYTGPDSFTYTVTDRNGKTSTATVNLTVDPLPVAAPDTVYTSVGAQVSGSTRGNDTGAGIIVTSYTQPAHGTAVVNPDGTYTYTPYGSYTGPDSFTYTITDRNGNTSTSNVNLTVDPLPVAANDAFVGAIGAPISGLVLTNDTGTGITVSSNTQPAHGVVAVTPDGTFSYTPAAGFKGDDSFTYTVTDRNGKTSTATVTLSSRDVVPPQRVGQDSIGANDFNYGTDEVALTPLSALELSKTVAAYPDGDPIPYDQLRVNQPQLDAINANIADKINGPMPLTYTTPDGTPVTIIVTLQDHGKGTPDDPNTVPDEGTDRITGNNFTVVGGGDPLTPDAAKELASVVARDKNGNPIDLSAVEADPTELGAINDAIAANEAGEFPLTFVSPDGTPVTVMVTVTHTNTPPVINVERPILYVQKGVTLTQDQILKLAGVSIDDAEEGVLGFNHLTASGYDNVKWSVVNYPGVGYLLTLQAQDTPGLKSAVHQIVVFVEPADTAIKDKNPDPDFPVTELPDGTKVGTDSDGNPIIWAPAKNNGGNGVKPAVPAAAKPAAPKGASGLPKTGDIVSVTTPLLLAAAALFFVLLAYQRRKRAGAEQA